MASGLGESVPHFAPESGLDVPLSLPVLFVPGPLSSPVLLSGDPLSPVSFSDPCESFEPVPLSEPLPPLSFPDPWLSFVPVPFPSPEPSIGVGWGWVADDGPLQVVVATGTPWAVDAARADAPDATPRTAPMASTRYRVLLRIVLTSGVSGGFWG